MKFGQRLRFIRESKGLFLREVAAALEIDTALISKVERGSKLLNRNHLKKLADLYEISEDELTILWLAERILKVVNEEPLAELALRTAIKRINGEYTSN